MTVLMTLGEIRFSVEEGSYRQLSQTLEIRVARMDRAGGKSGRQVLGEDMTIDIEGVCYPGQRHAMDRVDSFVAAARTHKPQMLTDGRGNVWGEFLIERVERRTGEGAFDASGAPLREDFRLSLGAVPPETSPDQAQPQGGAA
ncbi:phage tail protein [Brevundimonas sp.]|uniref:phage tail protein n=1 Tax=Brevundimonas sp. TaxID=1871086 RepID=UPI0028AE11EE|nr:phage tail protein [Brevundimonas sp.]